VRSGGAVDEIQGEIRSIDEAAPAIDVAGHTVRLYEYTRFRFSVETLRPATADDRKLLNAVSMNPVVIGCSAGSGSRLLWEILAASPDIHLDSECGPHARDSRGSQVFLDADSALSRLERQSLVIAFMARILRQIPDRDHAKYRWFGWKNPRNLRIIDDLMAVHPQLHFVHLVRNPAALVNSRLPQRFYQRQLIERGPNAHRSLEEFVLTAWAHQNAPVFHQYATHPRYRLVRYEDLLRSPRETIESLFAWLGVSTESWRAAALCVSPPADAVTRGTGVSLDFIEHAALQLGYTTVDE
jgi:hypothetical protein